MVMIPSSCDYYMHYVLTIDGLIYALLYCLIYGRAGHVEQLQNVDANVVRMLSSLLRYVKPDVM